MRQKWYYHSDGAAFAAQPELVVNEAGEPAPEGKDALVSLSFDEERMTAEAVAEPPEGTGRDLTREDIDAALAEAGVVFGVDEAALEKLAAPLYGQPVVVARGLPAQDGEDGVVTELFAREAEKNYGMRENGTMDYKDTGKVRDLPPGTVVCEMTLPTEGTDGSNVLGQPVKARVGQPAVPLVADNISITEDGRRAETTVRGNLVFRNNHFLVDTVVRVMNVDYESGNIVFSGDVMIEGDVLDGFEVHAGGNVTLHGQGGAVVIKGTNIVIDKGINGTGKAVLEASGTVQSGFIENCTVLAGEKVVANSIINCQVECEGDVEVSGGKGIICGGKVTAFGNVKAKVIGNDFNTLTTITLGVTPKLLAERKRLEDNLEDVSAHLEELAKNVAYVEKLVADGRPVPQERVQLLKRAQIQLPMTERKKEQLEKQLAELDAKMREVNQSVLQAGTIHPPTKVSIGALSTNVTEVRMRSRIYKKDGELVFGSL